MAPTSLPRKPLRPGLPSIVQLIDRKHPEPDFAQFAEFNLPARPKLTVRTPEAGNGDRQAQKLPWRSRFIPWIVLGLVFVAFAWFWWRAFGA